MRRICSELQQAFGARLKAERLRLGLSQTQCGEVAGVQRLTQARYESQGNLPALDYLEPMERAGMDPLYLLSGSIRTALVLSEDDLDLFARCIDLVASVAKQQGHEVSTDELLRASIRTFHDANGGKVGQPLLPTSSHEEASSS
jgi:transcriptional regulator with XRE-family HTH domain